MDYLKELKEANDIIRSFHAIIERKGMNTNWDGVKMQVDKILLKQHEILYPKPKTTLEQFEDMGKIDPEIMRTPFDI